MEKYAILILPITLSIIILVAGSIAFYMPLRWEERHSEDATLPAVLILCVPSFGFILSAYLITGGRMKREIRFSGNCEDRKCGYKREK